MPLLDIFIVLLVLFGLVTNYQRGFVAVAINIGSLLAGMVAASILYQPLAGLIHQFYNAIPAILNVIAYLWVLVVSQFILLFAARYLVHKLPKEVVLSKLNHVGGSVVGAIQMLVLTSIGLVLFMTLPFSSATKDKVNSSVLARPLLSIGGNLDFFLASIPGKDFTQTFNLLTVKPDSEESIKLNFTTTQVKPNPEAETKMLQLVNNERTSRGLKALKPNDSARKVARAHSTDMFARGYFAHVNPDGLDPFERMERGGVKFSSAGENLALAPTLLPAHYGLMNSPGHRANILSPDFGTVGIGVIDGGPYGLMITQNFTN